MMKSEAEVLYLVVLHIGRHLREVDREVGLSGTRFSILASLQFHGTTNLAELAEDEKVSRPAITRLVRDMVKDEQVVVQNDPNDGRSVKAGITTKGRRLLFAARKRKISIIEGYLSTLASDERETLEPTLRKLANTIWPDE